jgi:Exocyst complex component Sec3, coiled-coil
MLPHRISLTYDGAQAVSDDISYIQSQNRGLQVQTQNQKSLLTELEQLLVRLFISFVVS